MERMIGIDRVHVRALSLILAVVVACKLHVWSAVISNSIGHVTICSVSESHFVISLKQNRIEFKLKGESHGHRSESYLSIFSMGNVQN